MKRNNMAERRKRNLHRNSKLMRKPAELNAVAVERELIQIKSDNKTKKRKSKHKSITAERVNTKMMMMQLNK